MATVVQLLTPLQYPPGALVYRKGEVGLDMYFITHGQAEILVRNDDAEDGNQVVSVCGVARCDVFLACSHLLLRVVSRLWAPETSSEWKVPCPAIVALKPWWLRPMCLSSRSITINLAF